MAGKFAMLQKIEHDHTITVQTDPAFLHRMKQGLLLTLREQGVLSVTQYRFAEEKLGKQVRSRAGQGEET